MSSQWWQSGLVHRRGEAGRAGPAPHVRTAKYCDYLPLYRQSAIYARAGVELERSTLGVAELAELTFAAGAHRMSGDGRRRAVGSSPRERRLWPMTCRCSVVTSGSSAQ